jgi:hypothetical protein
VSFLPPPGQPQQPTQYPQPQYMAPPSPQPQKSNKTAIGIALGAVALVGAVGIGFAASRVGGSPKAAPTTELETTTTSTSSTTTTTSTTLPPRTTLAPTTTIPSTTLAETEGGKIPSPATKGSIFDSKKGWTMRIDDVLWKEMDRDKDASEEEDKRWSVGGSILVISSYNNEISASPEAVMNAINKISEKNNKLEVEVSEIITVQGKKFIRIVGKFLKDNYKLFKIVAVSNGKIVEVTLIGDLLFEVSRAVVEPYLLTINIENQQ